eukprot:COSAG05_NODE_520_length_9047_cov_2.500224_12_plen_75_part_00
MHDYKWPINCTRAPVGWEVEQRRMGRGYYYHLAAAAFVDPDPTEPVLPHLRRREVRKGKEQCPSEDFDGAFRMI